ncbi:CBS domain-containing protein [Nitrospira sp. Kam-Ns4a]
MPKTAEQFLPSTVCTVTPETTVAEAAAMMAERNVGDLVVVKDMRPVGILTDRDIAVRAVAAGRSPGRTPVHTIMSWPLITITWDQDIGSAVALMTQHGIRRLPIADEQGRLVPILTLDDLLLLGLDGMPVLTEVLRTQLRCGTGAAARPIGCPGERELEGNWLS